MARRPVLLAVRPVFGARLLTRRSPVPDRVTRKRTLRETVSVTNRLPLTELLAGLSMVSDLRYRLPVDTALRSCVVGTSLARRMNLSESEVSDVFFVSLLFHVGCVAYSHETAERFGDDLAVNHAAIKTEITSVRDVFARLIPESTRDLPAMERLKGAATMAVRGQAFGRAHNQASCEVARDMARRVGLRRSVGDGLYDMHEWWNGRGARGVRGEEIARSGRVARVATEASWSAWAAATRSTLRCDVAPARPSILQSVECLAGDATARVEEAMAEDPTAMVLDTRPRPSSSPPDEAAVVRPGFRRHGAPQDAVHLRSRPGGGSAGGGGREAGQAGRQHGRAVRVCGYLHDLGRIGVSNRLWEKPGPLTTGEWSR